MILLKCQCCGFVKVFKDADEAFREGWDSPPHFTGYVCCDLCPGSFVVMGITHKHEAAHKRWAVEGRPEKFEDPGIEPLQVPVPPQHSDVEPGGVAGVVEGAMRGSFKRFIDRCKSLLQRRGLLKAEVHLKKE